MKSMEVNTGTCPISSGAGFHLAAERVEFRLDVAFALELGETVGEALRTALVEDLGLAFKLVDPPRTIGKVRLYSDEDLERLRQIKHLVHEQGVNIAGLDIIVKACDQLDRIEALLGDVPMNGPRRRVLGEERLQLRRIFGRDA
jgi:hypothetical protein